MFFVISSTRERRSSIIDGGYRKRECNAVPNDCSECHLGATDASHDRYARLRPGNPRSLSSVALTACALVGVMTRGKIRRARPARKGLLRRSGALARNSRRRPFRSTCCPNPCARWGPKQLRCAACR